MPRMSLTAIGLALLLAACASPAAPAPSPAPTAERPTSTPRPPTAEPAASPEPSPAPTDELLAPGEPERIAFADGATSGAVEGALARGEERRYIVGARAGQQMRVRISSPEDNAVFQIYVPGGAFLAGAEPGSDAQQWEGRLPAGGDYLLSVGSTRGGATYRLEISITGAASTGDTSIRLADWRRVLESDPLLRAEDVGGERYVTVTAEGAQVGGIPQLQDTVYLDMDSDGVEEAAIPLFSGGTAGNVGVLIFRLGPGGPLLTDWRDGYKLGVGVEAGQLVISNALYAGWEPNCCPSGRAYATFVLQDGKLALVAERDEGNEGMRAETVAHYYELINAKDYAGAYALLAAPLRAATPFDTWQAGYATMVSVEAVAEPDPADPTLTRVTITAVDQGETGQVTRRFAGTWATVWEAERPGWALSEAQIAPVP